MKPEPALTPQALADREARLEREAAALRDNLRRRTAHRRAREAQPDTVPQGPATEQG